jgi:hypothetical protein
MPGQEVVELPESPYPEFGNMDGTTTEFFGECCQVFVFDILYGLDLMGERKGPELTPAYLEGLDGAVGKSVRRRYSRHLLQRR